MKKSIWYKNVSDDPNDIIILESVSVEKSDSGIPSKKEFDDTTKKILEKCDDIFKELAK